MKTENVTGFNFRPATGIRWLRNSGEMIIINNDLSMRSVLQEIEADVWEWLWQKFDQQSIINMIALMNQSTEIQAQQQFKKIVASWEKHGFYQRAQTD